jgi:hypothetical protein
MIGVTVLAQEPVLLRGPKTKDLFKGGLQPLIGSVR